MAVVDAEILHHMDLCMDLGMDHHVCKIVHTIILLLLLFFFYNNFT